MLQCRKSIFDKYGETILEYIIMPTVLKKQQRPVCSVKGDFTLFVILVLVHKHTEQIFHTLLSFICI